MTENAGTEEIHSIFDGIGLRFAQGEDDWLLDFIPEHFELESLADADQGWKTGTWMDPSGAVVDLLIHLDDHRFEVAPGFVGGEITRLSYLEFLEDHPDLLVGDLLDEDGETITRLAVQSAQWIPRGSEALLVVSALARSVSVYADESEFLASPDSKLGEGSNAVELSASSFIPVGLFVEPGVAPDPMAMFAGQVVSAASHVNRESGQRFVAARVRTLDSLEITVLWPQGAAPVPAVGAIVSTTALITARLPQ